VEIKAKRSPAVVISRMVSRRAQTQLGGNANDATSDSNRRQVPILSGIATLKASEKPTFFKTMPLRLPQANRMWGEIRNCRE